MPSLLELQRAMARAIAGGDGTTVEALILPDGLPAAARLAIHRETFLGGAVGALKLALPAVERLVGRDFFEAAARTYVRGDPPRGNDLNRYGEGFGDFLEAFGPASPLPYLADVARLELALDRARQAPDAAPLALERLAAVPADDQAELRLDLHPSVTLLRLAHAADTLHQAVLAGAEQRLAGETLGCACRLLVARAAAGPLVRRCTEGEALLVERLLAGRSLGDALDGAEGEGAASLLAELLGGGLVVGLRLPDSPYPASGDTT